LISANPIVGISISGRGVRIGVSISADVVKGVVVGANARLGGNGSARHILCTREKMLRSAL
jgi:hypothetical protein